MTLLRTVLMPGYNYPYSNRSDGGSGNSRNQHYNPDTANRSPVKCSQVSGVITVKLRGSYWLSWGVVSRHVKQQCHSFLNLTTVTSFLGIQGYGTFKRKKG